ncbi:MAG: bifunctional phosphoribosyl-AMP cyclohydrolase/phosphoribosyl-ATP diphosphatase HisIE [Lachnospiraceae bacterium]|nr:bifunctional phosphoribosyl-AMP cyclohydrolase/phosphoribosyl-ATP diphosphatase HisIE [Lachnospiraceae bacterium]
MTYKCIIPSIYLKDGVAVDGFDGGQLNENAVDLAAKYSNYGADYLIVFDLSDDDGEHEKNLDTIRAINRVIDIPMVGAGNVKRLEDVKKLLYAGCKKAALNFAKVENISIAQEVCQRFGRDKLASSIDNVAQLSDNETLIKNCTSLVIIVNTNELDNVMEWITKRCTDNANPVNLSSCLVYGKKNLHEIASVLRTYDLTGISGGDINTKPEQIMSFKRQCKNLGINVNTFDSSIKWEELKKNSEGLIPVIIQDYKTAEVLMLAYMNEEAFNKTLESGLMTYWSRSRNELWIKGETSGHYQYVKSLTADCDYDTILAKVHQIGAACHTGKRSCFFNQMMKKEYSESNPLKVFEDEYNTILDRKENPKEGSYTNYLFDKGVDKILKKVGEECTEVIIAAKNPNPEELKYEIADWLYHAMVLMVEKGVTWEEITKEIARR